jgi:hypothetical protein
MRLHFAEPDDIEIPTNDVQRSQSHSALRHSLALQISNATLQRSLQKDLRYYPYKIQITQHREDQDNTASFLVCLDILDNDGDVSNLLIISYEADIHHSG